MHLAPHNKQLLAALRARDLDGVERIVARHPELLAAPTGEPAHGDLLAFAAQCGDLAAVRFAFERIERPDVQAALGRACRSPVSEFKPIIEFFLARGGNPGGLLSPEYGPIVFVPCENLQPDVLRMLIALGADPAVTFDAPDGHIVTPLDIAVSTPVRAPGRLHQCIAVLALSGAHVADSAVMAVYRGDEEALERHLQNDTGLVAQRFDVPSANTPLLGATLLHIAAEFCETGIARLLIDRGADINAAAGVDSHGFGGQTPIYHTVNSIWNKGVGVFNLLIERGADVSLRVGVRHGGCKREFENITPLGYALGLPRDGAAHPEIVDVLRLVGAEE